MSINTQSITNPFYNPEEHVENMIQILIQTQMKALRNDEKYIKSRTVKSKNSTNKYSTNTNAMFRKNHNIKQPRGSIRHGSSR